MKLSSTYRMLFAGIVALQFLYRVNADWDNGFDAPLFKYCLSDQMFSAVKSEHSNSAEDRRWEWICSEYDSPSASLISWSEKTGLDSTFAFECPFDEGLWGVYSTHYNYQEDREWYFACRESVPMLEPCTWTDDYVNIMDGKMDFSAPEGSILAGVYTHHSNYYEDRRFKFKTCEYCYQISWSLWTNWSPCPSECFAGPDFDLNSQSRSRECENYDKQRPCTGYECSSGAESEERTCNMAPCRTPIDGGLSCWTVWSACSATCGYGTRTRTRECSNPAPRNGGADCVGELTESEDCQTVVWGESPMELLGTPDKVASSASTVDLCQRACVDESTFDCKSAEFRTFTSECRLWNIDAESFEEDNLNINRNVLLSEKTCADLEDVTQIIRPESFSDTIDDGCDTSDCYSECGSSDFVETMTTAENHLIIRKMRFDLKDLPNMVPSGIRRVYIYAQTVVQTANIDVGNYRIMIVSRQFISTGFGIKHPQDSTYFDFSSGCVVDFKNTDCNWSENLKMVSRSGYVDLLTQQFTGISELCGGVRGRYINDRDVRLDDLFLKMSLGCVAILTTKGQASAVKVTKNIITNTKLQIAMSKDLNNADVEEFVKLRGLANVLDNEILLRQEGKRFVPQLSVSAMSEIIGFQASIITSYKNSYENAVSDQRSDQQRVNDFEALVETIGDEVTLERKKHEYAMNALETSELAIEKLRDGLSKAKDAIDDAKIKFDAGIEAYKKKAIVSAVFGFLGAITGSMSALGGIAKGKRKRHARSVLASGTDEWSGHTRPYLTNRTDGNDSFPREERSIEVKFEESAAMQSHSHLHHRAKRFILTIIKVISTIMALIAKMIEIILKIIKVTKTIARAQKALDGIAVDDPPPMPTLNDVLNDIDATAALRVNIVEYKNLKVTTVTALGQGAVTEIEGSHDYRRALDEFANWGEELTKQTITHSDLLRTEAAARLSAELAVKKEERYAALLDQAQSDFNAIQSMVNDIQASVFNVQLGIIMSMATYCNSYYFFNLIDCTDEHIVAWKDSLNSVYSIVQTARSSQIENTQLFSPRFPTAMKVVYIAEDADDICEPTSSLSDTCPIASLKSFKEAIFQIPLTAEAFSGRDRLRIEEVRIYLAGATILPGNSEVVDLLLESSGDMLDRYKSQEFEFVSGMREFRFQYDSDIGNTLAFACIHSSLSHVVSQMTPFTTWTLQILNADNLDLSGLTGVEIYFNIIGIAQDGVAFADVPIDLEFKIPGQASVSQECGTSAGRKKRSLKDSAYVNTN